MTSNDLRDEITSVIYGDDWKTSDIADAFKPDVEAIIKLFEQTVESAKPTIYKDVSAPENCHCGHRHYNLDDPAKVSHNHAINRYEANLKRILK